MGFTEAAAAESSDTDSGRTGQAGGVPGFAQQGIGERTRPPEPGDLGGDLWGAPASALPLGDDGMFGADEDDPSGGTVWPILAEDDGPPPSVPDTADPDPGSPSAPGPPEHGSRRSSALALSIAVVILVLLGYTAQQLAPSGDSDNESSGNRVSLTGNGASSGSGRASPTPGAATAPDVVANGPADCRMRLVRDQRVLPASPSGQDRCFLIE